MLSKQTKKSLDYMSLWPKDRHFTASKVLAKVDDSTLVAVATVEASASVG